MAGFSAPSNYDAIFSVGDSLNYLTEKKDFERAIESTYKHLNENGIFISGEEFITPLGKAKPALYFVPHGKMKSF